MNNTTRAALGLILGVAGSAQAEPPSSLYALAWEDTFGGTSVDTSRWNFRTDVKRFSSQRPANAVVSNGRFSILMKREDDRGMQYTFGYGYYEVVARTTTNQGWHNSFWMMRGDGSTTFGPGRYLEIDSFEIDTQRPSTISAS